MLVFAAIDFSQSLQSALDDVTTFVPQLIGALVILVIGWFVARIIQRVAVSVLRKVRFDDLVDRSGLGGPLERAGFADSGVLLAKFLYYAVLLLALQMAVNVFGQSEVQEAFGSLMALLPQIVIAAIIVVIAGAIANAVKGLLTPAVAHLARGELLVKAAVGVIWVVGIFAAIDQVGVAEDITNTLFRVLVGSLGLILVIKFGVGGIWAARDRFWPQVYDNLGTSHNGTATAATAQNPTQPQPEAQQPAPAGARRATDPNGDLSPPQPTYGGQR